MASDAAKERLDLVRSDIKRVQSIYAAVGIFIVVLGFTLLLQHKQLRDQEAELGRVNVLAGYPWRKLETFYLQAPFDDYQSKHVEPWYQVCLGTSVNLMATRQCDQQLNTPETEETVKRISDSGVELSYLNTKLGTIIAARRFNTPFENLDSFKLRYLLDVFTFKPKEGQEAFTDGLAKAQLWAKAFLSPGRKVCNGLEPTQELIKTFREGANLEEFKTLRDQYVVEDIRALGDEEWSDESAGKMASALDNKQISTLSNLYAKQVQLNRDTEKLRNDTAVSLPVVGVAVPVNLLGTLGGLLTLLLIFYVVQLLMRITANLKRAHELDESPDRGYYEAVVAAIPFAQATLPVAIAAIVIILVTPGIVRGWLYVAQEHGTLSAWTVTAFGVAAYVASAIIVAVWTQRIARLTFI